MSNATTVSPVANPTAAIPPRTTSAKILAVTSGKGGVGKTFVCANLAAALVRRGRKVLLLDADLGLANLDIVLNLHPKMTLHDVLTGRATVDDAVLVAPCGVAVLPAASGLVEYSRLTGEVQDELRTVITDLGRRYDYLMLDTGAGISDIVLFTASLAQDVLVVATPEPTSIADAYATVKILAMLQKREDFRLVFNQVRNTSEGGKLARQLQGVVDQFLKSQLGGGIRLQHLGDIPLDPAVPDAVRKRSLLIEAMPGAPAAKSIVAIAAALDSPPAGGRVQSGAPGRL
jgi:flagellar biosynthesis protein FlhG